MGLTNLIWPEGNHFWLFTTVVDDLIWGLLRTNPVSVQGGNWTLGQFSAPINCTEANIDSLSNSLDVISILSHAVLGIKYNFYHFVFFFAQYTDLISSYEFILWLLLSLTVIEIVGVLWEVELLNVKCNIIPRWRIGTKSNHNCIAFYWVHIYNSYGKNRDQTKL